MIIPFEELRFFVKSEPFTDDGDDGMKLVRVCLIDADGFELEAPTLATSHVDTYSDVVQDADAAADIISGLIYDIRARYAEIEVVAGVGGSTDKLAFFRCEDSPCSVSL